MPLPRANRSGTGRLVLLQRLGFSLFVDLPNKFHPRPVQKGGDLFAKTRLVSLVDLGRDLEVNTEGLGNLNGTVGPLFRRDTSEEDGGRLKTSSGACSHRKPQWP